MENLDNLEKTEETQINLIVSEEMRSYLYETIKWTNFIAYFGLILSGLLLILSFSITTFLQKSNPDFSNLSSSLSIIYLILSLVLCYPSFLLLRYSKNTKKAVLYGEQEELEKATQTLKSYFKFQGLIIIFGLSFYLLAILSVVFKL